MILKTTFKPSKITLGGQTGVIVSQKPNNFKLPLSVVKGHILKTILRETIGTLNSLEQNKCNSMPFSDVAEDFSGKNQNQERNQEQRIVCKSPLSPVSINEAQKIPF